MGSSATSAEGAHRPKLVWLPAVVLSRLQVKYGVVDFFFQSAVIARRGLFCS
jgi:hypothetical protein